MKIELDRNKVLFNNGSSIQEIHPFWLRERVDGEEYLDKGTQQRLFDPSSMSSSEVIIEKAKINEGFLEIDFNDGVNFKISINRITSEFSNKDTVIKSINKIKWDANLKDIKNFNFSEDFFESREMHDLLVSFYEYGFVIIKNVPTENNYNQYLLKKILHFPFLLYHKLTACHQSFRMYLKKTLLAHLLFLVIIIAKTAS